MLKTINKRYSKRVAKILVYTLLLAGFSIAPPTTNAASVTTFSDTLTRIQAATAANHEIKFASPTGVAAGQSIIIDFDDGGSDFDGTSVDAILFSDVDFATGNSSNCTSATYTEQTLAAAPVTTTWGVTSSTTQITILSGTGTSAAGNCMRIRIGTNAVSQTTGVNQILNGSAGTALITLSGTFTDTGTAAIPIITDDTVNVTATVDPTITFTLSDTTIGFGTLTSGAARYANGAATGSGTDVAAHNFTIATNAASGYVVTYNGASLTKGGDVIDPVLINNDADGTAGTEEFAISLDQQTGDGTTTATYDHNDGPDWNFVASTTTTIYSETVPTATETVDVHYIANIAGNTPAGLYTTDITYIATGTF